MRTVTHEYDRGFLSAIPGYASSFTYHDNLALKTVAHANGVTDWLGQDAHRLPRPSALWTSGVANGEDWNSGAYQYDGAGNIRAIGGQRYRYDGVSRLREAELRIPETSSTLFGVESFVYDAYGNLTSRTTTEGGSGTTVNSPADPATNRLTGATSYDPEGNLTSWNGAQYSFDALGQMTRMQSGSEDWIFAFSAGGERVVQIDQGGAGDRRWTVRDLAGRVLREWVEPQGGSPTWERDWIYRGGQPLATIDATTTRHLTLDHLGTPRLITDQSGAKLAFHAYWPYGREATDPSQDELSKKFTGHERDGFGTSSSADDLDYMHARFANPGTGRFLSVDPSAGSQGLPQSFNRYAYGISSPLMFTDPTGKFFELYVPQLIFEETITSVANGVPLPPVDPSVIAENFFQSISRPIIPRGAYVDSGSHPSLAALKSVRRWFLSLFQNARKGGGDDGGGESGGGKGGSKNPCANTPSAPAGYDIDSTLNSVRAARAATDLTGAAGPLVYGAARAGFLGSLADMSLSPGAWNFKMTPGATPAERLALSTFGNFHYGAVGNAAGLSLSATLAIAGAAELLDGDGLVGPAGAFFDQPEDIVAIAAGWYYAEACAQ